MLVLGVLVFVTTYLLISSRRVGRWGLDRPSAVLCGALACVLTGLLTPLEALHAIDGDTLLLLFGSMGLGAFLEIEGFFAQLENLLAARRPSPARLLAWILWGAGGLSALITNDAVCVLGAPLVVRLIRRHRLPALPFLLALATGANTGSAATLVGNPQNMLCGILGQLRYLDHLLWAGPITVACLALNHAFLVGIYRRSLEGARIEAGGRLEDRARIEDDTRIADDTQADDHARSEDAAQLPQNLHPASTLSTGAKTSLLVVTATAAGYALGFPLAWTALSGFALLLLLRRRHVPRVWNHIDWPLLVFFAGLFVVVAGFTSSGAPAALFRHFPLFDENLPTTFAWLRTSAIFLIGSNLVSNVPFILIVREQMASLPEPRMAWELLAVVSTFAGNLTLPGSVANLIVAEKAREIGGIGFFQYLKVGMPLAILSSLLATVWLLALGGS